MVWMNTTQLKEYMGYIVDMEKNCYLQNNVAKDIQQRISSLDYPIESYPCPAAPEPVKKSGAMGSILIFILCIIMCAAGTFVGAFLLTAALFILSLGGNLFNIMYDAIPITGGVVGLCITGYFSYHMLTADSHKSKEYHKKLLSYENECKEVQKKNEAAGIDYFERMNKIAVWKGELAKIMQSYNASRNALEKMYAKDIVYSKYRNLIAVCSLYEYIVSGRCFLLEGPDGAYNVLENEIRLDNIIIKLENIVNLVNSIKQNQYTLYCAIQDTNKHSAELIQSTERMSNQITGQLSGINNKLSNVEERSSITAFCAERTQKEVEYMNRMNDLDRYYEDK